MLPITKLGYFALNQEDKAPEYEQPHTIQGPGYTKKQIHESFARV